MIARFLVAAALAASLTATTAAAQSAADLLQKGIYTQETAGDADAAIQIFRQVAASGAPQALKAQAQSHIVGALLQKGDLAASAQEFERLAREFADQEEMVESMAQRLRTIAENGPAFLLGTFQNGKYHHHWTGVEFTVPSDWTVKKQEAHPAPDGGDLVNLTDSTSAKVSSFIRIKRQDIDASAINGRLRERLEYKLSRQRVESSGYFSYHLRPESVQNTIVGGQKALIAEGDFVDSQGQKRAEYMGFVQSEKTEIGFSVRAPAADFPSVQSRFEQIVRSVVIP